MNRTTSKVLPRRPHWCSSRNNSSSWSTWRQSEGCQQSTAHDGLINIQYSNLNYSRPFVLKFHHSNVRIDFLQRHDVRPHTAQSLIWSDDVGGLGEWPVSHYHGRLFLFLPFCYNWLAHRSQRRMHRHQCTLCRRVLSQGCGFWG